MEARPAIALVFAHAAPQAVRAQADFFQPFHPGQGHEPAFPDRVGGERQFAQQHETVHRQVDDTSQALP
ncbi:hypothetical protein D3C85_1901660 [compost metagenome]